MEREAETRERGECDKGILGERQLEGRGAAGDRYCSFAYFSQLLCLCELRFGLAEASFTSMNVKSLLCLVDHFVLFLVYDTQRTTNFKKSGFRETASEALFDKVKLELYSIVALSALQHTFTSSAFYCTLLWPAAFDDVDFYSLCEVVIKPGTKLSPRLWKGGKKKTI